MVPIANAVDIGLRAPINNSQCDRLLKILSADFTNPPIDWKDRYKEFLERMKTGDIFHVAEVLKTHIPFIEQASVVSREEDARTRALPCHQRACHRMSKIRMHGGASGR
jgi:CarD family transcriptional regulator